jgi:3-phenylpropionate/trans-cinnamate dioxygenase ferredoxin component
VTFQVVDGAAALEPGEALGVEIDGVDVCIARDEDGDWHALGDICSHGQVNLSDGDVEGCAIECWKHGSQFDLVSGRPLQLPATVPVPVYPLRSDDDGIAVDVAAAQS